jgi:hypothetical protein
VDLIPECSGLLLFVGGKPEVEGLGGFCCASRPLRQEAAASHTTGSKP